MYSCLDEVNATTFDSIRKSIDMEKPPEKLHMAIIGDVEHDVEIIRRAAAVTLAEVLKQHPCHVLAVLEQLFDMYEKRLIVSLPRCPGRCRACDDDTLVIDWVL